MSSGKSSYINVEAACESAVVLNMVELVLFFCFIDVAVAAEGACLSKEGELLLA